MDTLKNYAENPAFDGNIEHLNVWQEGIIKIVNIVNKNVIDIGCGSGSLLKAILPKAASVIGVDPNPKNIAELSRHKIPGEVCFIEDRAVNWTNRYDIAICSEVIEHLYNHKSLFLAAKGIIKTEGVFCVSTPNAFNIVRALDFIILQRHHDSLMDPTVADDPQHIRAWSYGMLRRALQQSGFTKIKGYGVLKLFRKTFLLKNEWLIKQFSQNLIFTAVK